MYNPNENTLVVQVCRGHITALEMWLSQHPEKPDDLASMRMAREDRERSLQMWKATLSRTVGRGERGVY